MVGGGESAVQIAVEVSRHADVTLATRRPVKFTKVRPRGDAVGWKIVRHVGRLPFGKAIIALMEWSPYVMDTGCFRAAFATGKPDRREMFLGGEGAELRWRDGRGELGGAGWDACYVARRLRRELESRQLRCCARH